MLLSGGKVPEGAALRTDDPEDLGRDLEPVLARARSARLVALGEATKAPGSSPG